MFETFVHGYAFASAVAFPFAVMVIGGICFFAGLFTKDEIEC